MNKLFTYLLIIVLCSFIACHQPVRHISKDTSLQIDSTQNNNELTEKLITPYKTKLDAEMNEVLVISAEEFPKEKGKSETKLGNLVADLSFEIAKDYYNYKDNIDFCLLNFGGLRTSLPKGKITRGKIFELMPFENELIIVTINKQRMDELLIYLKKSGGQPIAGNLTIHFNKNTHLITQHDDVSVINSSDSISYSRTRLDGEATDFRVLTTDYLAKGGDNMTFFANPIKYEKVGIKLRDAIIQYCQEQDQQGKQLTGKLDGRITFE